MQGQESSHGKNLVGPVTKYGRALGSMQTLPATAREMAGKLGVPWRPDLLTDRSDQGQRYQQLLGEAYLKEGLAKTGNIRDALRYYHGGPDRSQWGPKTNAYAAQVMRRVGGNN